MKVFPPTLKSHTLDAKPNVGRSRISDASKAEECDGDRMLEIGLKEVLTMTGMMLFEIEDIQMSD